MPYCSQCGKAVDANDAFCANCGSRQPNAPPAGARPADPFAGMTPRTATILCYIPVVGWIAAIVVLASERFRANRNVRFHAFQGLYLFVAWLIVHEVIGQLFGLFSGPMYRADKVLEALLLFTWIFMIVKVSQEQTYSLPIIGELAEKSISED